MWHRDTPILMHLNPDPDAIASALLLRDLFGLGTISFPQGETSHTRWAVAHGVTLRQLTTPLTSAALVDHQSSDWCLHEEIICDHHPLTGRRSASTLLLHGMRGSCTTLLCELGFLLGKEDLLMQHRMAIIRGVIDDTLRLRAKRTTDHDRALLGRFARQSEIDEISEQLFTLPRAEDAAKVLEEHTKVYRGKRIASVKVASWDDPALPGIIDAIQDELLVVNNVPSGQARLHYCNPAFAPVLPRDGLDYRPLDHLVVRSEDIYPLLDTLT